MDFGHLFLDLSGMQHPTLADAERAGAPVVKYGLFINQLIDFLVIAFVIFLIVRIANRIQPRVEAATKDCPECLSPVPVQARRCRQCTAVLTPDR